MAQFSRKKVIEHKAYVIIVSTTVVINIILRRTAIMIKNLYWSSCKVPLMPFRC